MLNRNIREYRNYSIGMQKARNFTKNTDTSPRPPSPPPRQKKKKNHKWKLQWRNGITNNRNKSWTQCTNNPSVNGTLLESSLQNSLRYFTFCRKCRASAHLTQFACVHGQLLMMSEQDFQLMLPWFMDNCSWKTFSTAIFHKPYGTYSLTHNSLASP